MSDAPGLCASCRFAERVATRRGSVFTRCARSDDDPRYPRYPRLPVLQCEGYERRLVESAGRDEEPSC